MTYNFWVSANLFYLLFPVIFRDTLFVWCLILLFGKIQHQNSTVVREIMGNNAFVARLLWNCLQNAHNVESTYISSTYFLLYCTLLVLICFFLRIGDPPLTFAVEDYLYGFSWSIAKKISENALRKIGIGDGAWFRRRCPNTSI